MFNDNIYYNNNGAVRLPSKFRCFRRYLSRFRFRFHALFGALVGVRRRVDFASTLNLFSPLHKHKHVHVWN